ncbi:hypothetical protein K1719_023787 [Acacia pycnantha]|nr:hypothetical protein K1719_023787 [Acacia pycnantha]
MDSKHRSSKEPGIPLEKCIEWLNLHLERFVLYISFGSQHLINETKMISLALVPEGKLLEVVRSIPTGIGNDSFERCSGVFEGCTI